MPKPSQCLLGGFSPLYCFPRKGDFPVRYQLASVLSALLLCLTMLAAVVYGVGTQPALMQTLMLRTAPPEATGFPAEQYGAAAKLITEPVPIHCLLPSLTIVWQSMLRAVAIPARWSIGGYTWQAARKFFISAR